jgi:DNA-binding LacI/PurR family transcriptional regulator
MISIVFCGAGKYVVEQGAQYTRLLHGIEKEAAKQGMDVVMTTFRNADEFIETDTYNSVSGFLLVGDDTDSLENIFKGKSAVQVMGSDKKWGDHISYDNKTIGILAANYFASRHYKQLVCINVHKHDGDERCRMFKEHSEYLGVNVVYFNNPNALIKTDVEQHIEFDFLKECVDKIENTSPRPQGVFVVDLVAQPLYSILLERGIKPGRDIEIATCNWRNTTSAGGQYSPLNIDQRPEDIGMMAVRQLQWRMGNPEAKRMVIKIDPEILESNAN